MSVREVMAKRLKKLREAAGLTAQEVGDKVGKSAKTIYAWENGRGQPDADLLIKLSKIYNAKVNDFFEYAVVSLDSPTNVSWVEIPYYGSIAAGTPIEMLNVDDTYLVPSKIVNEHPGHRLGVLKIKGNSYNAGGIFDGFFVVVDFDETEPKNDHTPYAVSIDDETATVKAIEKLEDGLRLLPNSYDPTIQPITFDYGKDDGRNVSVLGEVVWTFAPFDYRF